MATGEKWIWQMVPSDCVTLLNGEVQRRTFEMLQMGKTQQEIADEEGVLKRTIEDRVHRIKERFAVFGLEPATKYQPLHRTPYIARNKTTHHKLNPETGEFELVQIWNKPTSKVDNLLDEMKDALSQLKDDVAPWDPRRPPRYTVEDLCTSYILTDYHVGQYSYALETGADWDVDIAEQVMVNAFEDMIAGTPDSRQAVLWQMGDFLDYDSLSPVTPTANNVLDVDGRYPRLIGVAIRALTKVIANLLDKHDSVRVVCMEGNHDLSGSVWLREVISAVFRNEPRVSIDRSILPFYGFLWGDTFLGAHHGHLIRNMKDLPAKFFSEPAMLEMMGQSKHRRIYCGHLHQEEKYEVAGCIVERFPTLSARSAHGARLYQMTNRSTCAITYDKRYAEIDRKTVYPRRSPEAP